MRSVFCINALEIVPDGGGEAHRHIPEDGEIASGDKRFCRLHESYFWSDPV